MCIGHTGKVVSKWPWSNTGTCPAGYKDLYKSLGMDGHNGEDWSLWYGEPVYHAGDFDGVAKTEVDKSGGIGVDVIGDDYKLRYWHLKAVAVYDGKKIQMGDLIGYGDSTGLSSGNHLHWSLKKVNSSGRTLNKDNGFLGAIDFRPYFENTFVLDVLDIRAKQLRVIDLLHQVIGLYKQLIGRKNIK